MAVVNSNCSPPPKLEKYLIIFKLVKISVSDKAKMSFRVIRNFGCLTDWDWDIIIFGKISRQTLQDSHCFHRPPS